jgi:hypothetical protein
MRNLAISILAALGAVAATAATAAAVPTQVSFAGRLAGADGPIDGNVQLTFQLYDDSTMVWEEDHSVAATAGLVFVSLGSIEALDSTIFGGASLELEIAIDGVPTSPRLPIRSVPYAMRSGRADDADRLQGQPATAFSSVGHRHDGTYLPVGTTLTCSGSDKVTGIGVSGDVTCAPDEGSVYSAQAGGGLALTGNAFGIANAGVTTARIADDAITQAKIAQGAVGNLEITASAVRSMEIQDGSIAAADLGVGSVGTSAIADDSVSRADLAGAEVTLYQFDSACDASLAGQLSLGAFACPSRLCSPGLYRNCGQTNCNAPIAVQATCLSQLRGYLLAP